MSFDPVGPYLTQWSAEEDAVAFLANLRKRTGRGLQRRRDELEVAHRCGPFHLRRVSNELPTEPAVDAVFVANIQPLGDVLPLDLEGHIGVLGGCSSREGIANRTV